MSKLSKTNKGFTIIEVMIVLAIAGLILLIVFLAVPALQRNSRNTQRKNEVAAIVGAVQEFANNNNGALPDPSDSAQTDTVLDNAKRSYYTDNSKIAFSTSGGDAAGPDDIDAVFVVLEGQCISPSAAPGDDISQDGSTRSFAVVYTIEQGGGKKLDICTDS